MFFRCDNRFSTSPGKGTGPAFERNCIVLSALVALNFSDFPAGVESGEGLDAARRELRRVPRVAVMAGAVNYASARHIAKYFARGRKW